MPEMVSQVMAMRLRAARKAAGFKTEKSFARKYHIPITTYSQHETGKRKMMPEVIMDYSLKLEINPGWLLTGEGEPFDKKLNKANITTSTKISRPFAKDNLALLKKIFLAGEPFLDLSSKGSFAQWIDQCFAIYGILVDINSVEEIEKINDK